MFDFGAAPELLIASACCKMFCRNPPLWPTLKAIFFVMDDCNDTSSVMLIAMDIPGVAIVCITWVSDSQVRGSTVRFLASWSRKIGGCRESRL